MRLRVREISVPEVAKTFDFLPNFALQKSQNFRLTLFVADRLRYECDQAIKIAETT